MKTKLIKFMMLTNSESEGEALNAIRMANKLLKKEGKTWEEVINSPTNKRKSFLDLTDSQIDRILIQKKNSGQIKEAMLATLFLKMKDRGNRYPHRARAQMNDHWSVK